MRKTVSNIKSFEATGAKRSFATKIFFEIFAFLALIFPSDLVALKSALAKKAYFALNKKEMYEQGTKEQRIEWAEAWDAWNKKTSF